MTIVLSVQEDYLVLEVNQFILTLKYIGRFLIWKKGKGGWEKENKNSRSFARYWCGCRRRRQGTSAETKICMTKRKVTCTSHHKKLLLYENFVLEIDIE